MFGHLLNMTDV